ncbi:MAG: hypothetical protein Q4B13_11310 [Lautropia sp.]|nr:hypothetical protein [Lautropia sp.]
MHWSVPLVLVALLAALAMRPWRLLRGGALLTPTLATLVLLPWMWALPRMHIAPVQLQWSGACLVVLMLGWPLAIPVLCMVGSLSGWFAPQPWSGVFDSILWLGVTPATFALLLGVLIRRALGEHPFVYILGRGFFGTVLCLFLSGMLAQWSGMSIGHGNDAFSSMVARWLLAWGDAFITGMCAAIFVAFKPGWLATWSDRLYLRRPSPDSEDGRGPVPPALDLPELHQNEEDVRQG